MLPPRARQLVPWLAVALFALLAAGAGFVAWLVGLGQYLEDYCFTRLAPPAGEGSMRGPVMDWPASVSCTYTPGGRVVVTDWAPVGFTAVVGVLVVGSVVAFAWWVRRRARVV